MRLCTPYNPHALYPTCVGKILIALTTRYTEPAQGTENPGLCRTEHA